MTDDTLRYPIGRFTAPDALSAKARAALVDRLAALPAALRQAVAGLDDAQLDTPYRDGGWTVRQVVAHVGDSHLNCVVRLLLALTEARPTIRPYDEGAWVEVMDRAALPLESLLHFVDVVHERLVAVARTVDDAAGARPWVHPDSGAHTVDGLLANYAWHGDHHVAHITRLRARHGW